MERSGASGVRLKEAQAINKSLATLGDVLQALATRQKHVPFRNSKLTYLLSDALRGHSKVDASGSGDRMAAGCGGDASRAACARVRRWGHTVARPRRGGGGSRAVLRARAPPGFARS